MSRAEKTHNSSAPKFSVITAGSPGAELRRNRINKRAVRTSETLVTKNPLLLTLALAWMLTIDSLTRLPLGPLSASGAVTLTGSILCLLLMPLVFMTRLRPGYLRRDSGVPLVMAAFVTYAIARLALSPSAEGLQNVAVYSSFVLAISITCVQITAPGADNVARRMRYAAVLVSMAFLVSFLAGITVYAERAYALVGLIFMAVLIPHRPRRIIYRAAPFFVAGVIALSLSRTATAIALVMLVFLSVRGKRGFRLIRSGIFAALAAGAAYWLITYYAPFRDRFIGGDNAASFGNVELNTSGRSVLWDMTIRSAEANPLFGNGPGTATALISGAFRNISHPHNEYLRLFHDFGYLGACLFVVGLVLLIAQTLKRALRADHPIHWAALMGLLAVVAAAFTDNVIIYPFVMVPLGVIVGASAGLSGENALPKSPGLDVVSTVNGQRPSRTVPQARRSPRPPAVPVVVRAGDTTVRH